MEIPDILIAIKPVISLLDKLSIPYYIGGSIASSVYGLPRATMDVDIVAQMDVDHIALFKQYLENDYYIDEAMIKEAIKQKSSFNLIHLETAIKIDIFIRTGDPFQSSALERRKKDTLEEDVIGTEFCFSSPEDTIINKLQWYELGERISERQWLDVIGVIKVQGDLLDKHYLLQWSQRLGIEQLLIAAFDNAGVQL